MSLDLETGDLGRSKVEEEGIWQWVEECIRNKEVQTSLSRSLCVREGEQKIEPELCRGIVESREGWNQEIQKAWAYLNAGGEKPVEERLKI